MTYFDIVKNVAQRTEYPKGICEAVLNALFEEIANGLREDGIVKLTNFATIYLHKYQQREIFDVSKLEYRVRPPVIKLKQKYSDNFKTAVFGNRYGKKYEDNNDE